MNAITSQFTENAARIIPDGYSAYFGIESLEGLDDHEAIEVLFDFKGFIEASPMTVFLLKNLHFDETCYPVAYKREFE